MTASESIKCVACGNQLPKNSYGFLCKKCWIADLTRNVSTPNAVLIDIKHQITQRNTLIRTLADQIWALQNELVKIKEEK